MRVVDCNGWSTSEQTVEAGIKTLEYRCGCVCGYLVLVSSFTAEGRSTQDLWVYETEGDAADDHDGSRTMGVISDVPDTTDADEWV